MKRQIKTYLSLFFLVIIQGGILSLGIKSKNSVSTETSTATNHNDNLIDAVKSRDCTEINEGIKDIVNVVAHNEETQHNENPTCTHDCRNEKQIMAVNWRIIPQTHHKCLKFHDIGVNPEGHIVTIGSNGKLYEYLFDLDHFELIEGDFDLYNLRRVDIGYDGLIYVVNYSGDTYYLSCNRYWAKLPGCAIDIGTGRGGEVVKIGCDGYCDDLENKENCPIHSEDVNSIIEKKSPHIYKLHCKCDCRCCRRRCNVFIKHVFTCEKDIDRKCYWIKYPVGPTCYHHKHYPMDFTRIDVNANGHPMVIGVCEIHSIKYYYLYQMIGNHENVFKTVVDKTTHKLSDLCGDNYGNILYIRNHKAYIYDKDYSKLIGFLNDDATNISCGPYGLPTVTTKKCCLKTTTKVGYN